MPCWRALGGEGRVCRHLHLLHHLQGDRRPERLEEAKEGGHAAELVEPAVHQVVGVDQSRREEPGRLQDLQNCRDPTSWRSLQYFIKSHFCHNAGWPRSHLQGRRECCWCDIMVKSKATEDETVHPLVAQVGNLKFPESGNLNTVKENYLQPAHCQARTSPRRGGGCQEQVRG